ncbi:MAG: hypothetical protein JWQ25_1088 [Daejeonella sp.]|nr:hypothetical protein [Daejeonella sp.]
MAFDQLTIKFEGLLRDLCDMAGLTIIKVREDQTLNKDVNHLLQCSELATKFQKEDLAGYIDSLPVATISGPTLHMLLP